MDKKSIEDIDKKTNIRKYHTCKPQDEEIWQGTCVMDTYIVSCVQSVTK